MRTGVAQGPYFAHTTEVAIIERGVELRVHFDVAKYYRFSRSAEPISALRVNRVVPLLALASGQQHDCTGSFQLTYFPKLSWHR
jgi:hypothetical protein